MKTPITLFLIFVCQIFGFAQELNFSAMVSRNQAAVGEQIKLTYSLNAMGNAFSAPDLSAFELLMGPQQMFGTQNVNGRVSQTLSFTYYIVGKKTGKFTIGPAGIRVGNGVMKSNSVEIEITKGASPSAGNQQQKQQNSSSSSQPGNGNDLYVKAIVSKASGVVGDQFLVTYKLYSRYSQLNYELSKAPTFNGFYTEDIALANKPNGEQESINGQNYLTAEIKKVLVFPQKSGKLEIPSIELNCVVRQRVQSQSIWDQMMGGGYRDAEVKIKSPAVQLDIKAHDAAGKPVDFNGAVGKFDTETNLDRSAVKAGEAVNLRIKISGKGNLKLIDPPVLNLPAELEVYDPQVKDNISVSSAGMNGTRTFEYLIIPRAGGDYNLGPLSFSWYDPDARQYKSEAIQSLQLKVEKGSGDAVVVNRNRASSGKPKTINEDIRFIHSTETELSTSEHKLFFLSLPFWSISALSPMAFIVFLLFRRRDLNRRQNVGLYRMKEAGSMASKRLKKASELLASRNKDAFYEEVYRTLFGYFSDKLKLPMADLNRTQIEHMLQQKSANDALVQKVLATLDACEFARFAPGASESMNEVYEQAASIIRELEQTIKS
jgi:hypothetical protein